MCIRDRLLVEGAGLTKLKELIEAQGGDSDVINNAELMKQASTTELITSPKSGYITNLDALSIGKAAVVLGAGRQTKNSEIDHSAGIELFQKIGSFVKQGDSIAKLYTNDKSKVDEAKNMVVNAFTFEDNASTTMPLIIKEIAQ